MNIIYRPAQKEDCRRIAELDDTASGGAIDFLFHDLIPNLTPVQIVAYNLEKDSYPHSFRSAIVAQHDKTIIGMSLSFPGKYHTITDEMTNFFPPDRMEHFKHFFSAPVGNSYFLDALCVDKNFRSKGIGSQLIELTKRRARKEGYHSLSLITYKDNIRAQKLYKQHGFEVTGPIELAAHERIPHQGGCLLMMVAI